MGIHDLWLFVAAGLLLNITPGPDIALVVARAGRYGRGAGIAAALGIGAGAFVHIIAGAIGLTALLVATPWAFSLLKLAGALYLMWIGVRMVWASFQAPTAELTPNVVDAAASWRSNFLQGVLTNALNPKVAMFFLAFLPQFIDASSKSAPLAFAALGLIFTTTGTLWNVGVAIAAGRLGRSTAAGAVKAWLDRVLGAAFVGLGLKLALDDRP